MEFIDVLLDYFSMYKKYKENNEHDKNSLKDIENIISILNGVKNRTEKIQYITNYKEDRRIATGCDIGSVLDEYLKEKYDTTRDNVDGYLKDIVNNINKGIDFIMYDIMLNLNRYNISLIRKFSKKAKNPVKYTKVGESNANEDKVNEDNKANPFENMISFEYVPKEKSRVNRKKKIDKLKEDEGVDFNSLFSKYNFNYDELQTYYKNKLNSCDVEKLESFLKYLTRSLYSQIKGLTSILF